MRNREREREREAQRDAGLCGVVSHSRRCGIGCARSLRNSDDQSMQDGYPCECSRCCSAFRVFDVVCLLHCLSKVQQQKVDVVNGLLLALSISSVHALHASMAFCSVCLLLHPFIRRHRRLIKNLLPEPLTLSLCCPSVAR